MSYAAPPLRKHRETAQDLLRDVDGASVEAVVANLLSSGLLAESMKHETGGEVRKITRGILTGRHPHHDECPQLSSGETSPAFVDFTDEVEDGFSQVPTVVIMPGGMIKTEISDPSEDLFIVESADGLDEQGFCMNAVLKTKGATNPEDDDFPAGTLEDDGDALSLAGRDEGQDGGNGLTATDVDHEYEARYSGTVTANSSQGDPQNVQATIHCDVWDSDASNPSWVEAGQKSHSVVTEGSKTIDVDGSIVFTWSALDAGDDVRLRLSLTVFTQGTGGASIDPQDVVYQSGADTIRSMSPNGERIRWWAFEGV